MSAYANYWRTIPTLQATRELGPAEDGVSRARVVDTPAGEFYVKHDAWSAETGTQIVANEFLSAAIASSMNVPIPMFAVVVVDGKRCFGCRSVRRSAPFVDAARLRGCRNFESLYSLLVFDVWLDNHDRHNGNVIIGQDGGRTVFWAIDHSHCPFPPRRLPHHLPALHGPEGAGSCIPSWYAREVTSIPLLQRAIDAANTLSDDEIADIVPGVPGQDWSESGIAQIVDFLVHRRINLRKMLDTARFSLSNLEGGSL
ncbi:MAG: hypothetical protein QM753_11870 [Thermomicrobiales bacterium]